MTRFHSIFLVLVWLSTGFAPAQSPSPGTAPTGVHPGRLRTVLIGEGVVLAGGVYGLARTWYQRPLENFHTFNDNRDWLQIDKIGHAYTAYQLTRVSASLYRWAGVSDRAAAGYGALNSVVFQVPIEVLDGFSPEYGFSYGDLAANLVGPVVFLSQQLTWGDVRITPKWSFHPTRLARVRPELLGRNAAERWLKDYNGQTYWLSANLSALRGEPIEGGRRVPKLLSVAVGYGIQDMVASDYEKSLGLGYRPVRQYFLSLDLDLTRIPTNSDLTRSLLFLANCLKIPAPALEIRTSRVPPKLKIKFHPIYF